MRRRQPRGTSSFLSPPRRRRPMPAARRAGAQIRWGAQIEVRAARRARIGRGSCDVRGYIAKYATKSTEAVGGLLYRARRRRHRAPARAPARAALRASARGDSALRAQLHPLRLRRWAHSLGFRGHCFTKSRRYSTTFTALRQARHEHVLRRNGERRDGTAAATCAAGTTAARGYRTPGDAWLAESGRKRARRAAARRARGTSHRSAVAGENRHEGRRQMSQSDGGGSDTSRRGRSPSGSGCRRTRSCATTARAGSRAGGCPGRSARCASCGARSRPRLGSRQRAA